MNKKDIKYINYIIKGSLYEAIKFIRKRNHLIEIGENFINDNKIIDDFPREILEARVAPIGNRAMSARATSLFKKVEVGFSSSSKSINTKSPPQDDSILSQSLTKGVHRALLLLERKERYLYGVRKSVML